MRGKLLIVGLTVLLVLVALAALAGPASAKQADKWNYFEATFVAQVWTPGTVWLPGGAPPDEPKQVMQTRDECFAGPYTAFDADGNKIDELSGYLEVYSDYRMFDKQGNFDKHGDFIVNYVNKSRLVVGTWNEEYENFSASSSGDAWEMSAVGTQVYVFTGLDPDTGLPLYDITDQIEGVGHGVAGSVKGWVLKFTGEFDQVTEAYYLAK